MAIIGSPKLLVVDEAFDRLSTEERAAFFKMLRGFRTKYKMTVVIAARSTDSVKEIATWYGIMERGSVISQFPAEELQSYEEETERPAQPHNPEKTGKGRRKA